MTTMDLYIRLNLLKNSLINNFPNWMMLVGARDSIAVIKKRIGDKGVGAEGKPFTPYSTKPMLIGASTFTSKGAAEKVFGQDKNKELQWRTIKGNHLAILPGGYKKVRELEGRQTNHKDFDRTTEMWKSIKPQNNYTKGGHVLIEIGSISPLSNKKLTGNTEREKQDILMMSMEEQIALAKRVDGWLQDEVNKILGI